MKKVFSFVIILFLITSCKPVYALSTTTLNQEPVYEIYRLGPDIDASKVPEETKDELQRRLNSMGDVKEGVIEFVAFNYFYDKDDNLYIDGFIRNGSIRNIHDLRGDITFSQRKRLLNKGSFDFTNLGVIKSKESVYRRIIFMKNSDFFGKYDPNINEYDIKFNFSFKS